MEVHSVNNWFTITHILGAAQGIFLAAILSSGRRASIANRILAVMMLAFSLDLATAVYHATGYYEQFPHFIGIDFPLVLLYGPLLYLYARTLTGRRFEPGSLWHFLPFAMLVLFLVPFYLQSGTDKLAFLNAPHDDTWKRTFGVINHVKLFHALVYLGFTIALLQRHRVQIKNTFSSTERISLTWLRNLMIGIVTLAGLSVVLYLLSLRDVTPVMGLDPATTYDDYMLLGLAVFVYTIGYMGLSRPEVLDGRSIEHSPARPHASFDSIHPFQNGKPEAATAAINTAGNPTPLPDKPQYAKSGMDSSTAREYKQQLIDLMENEKLYSRGDLTLQDLSDALSISPHNLTEVINTQIGQNFYDFVNGYRVREVQNRLRDSSADHLTLLAIGMEAGFNSKSSFNSVFKKHTSMTPSQYRAQTVDAS